MVTILNFTLWLILMVMVASACKRTEETCIKIEKMIETLDSIADSLESITTKLEKEGR